MDRMDLYAALYILCTLHHSGQASRGYRILSRLTRVYKPGLSVSSCKFENPEQFDLYEELLAKYGESL
jgi:hypothetical protein